MVKKKAAKKEIGKVGQSVLKTEVRSVGWMGSVMADSMVDMTVEYLAD